jgi:hypothetical protein
MESLRHLHTPRIERIASGIRVHLKCSVCQKEVSWKHVEIADDGRFLAGHCGCTGSRHRYALRPDEKVVDANGKPL